MSSHLVESGGVEPHPVLHKDPVFKTGRGTNSPASLSIIWRSQGDSNPCRRRDKPLYSPGYTMGPKTGATDGNRTRLNRIDNPVPYPEDYCGIKLICKERPQSFTCSTVYVNILSFDIKASTLNLYRGCCEQHLQNLVLRTGFDPASPT